MVSGEGAAARGWGRWWGEGLYLSVVTDCKKDRKTGRTETVGNVLLLILVFVVVVTVSCGGEPVIWLFCFFCFFFLFFTIVVSSYTGNKGNRSTTRRRWSSSSFRNQQVTGARGTPQRSSCNPSFGLISRGRKKLGNLKNPRGIPTENAIAYLPCPVPERRRPVRLRELISRTAPAADTHIQRDLASHQPARCGPSASTSSA